MTPPPVLLGLGQYGYSLALEPNALTLGEAQFGDFANGRADHVSTSSLSSGESRWSLRMSGLVCLMTATAYEAKGPNTLLPVWNAFTPMCGGDNWSRGQLAPRA